MVGNSGLRIKHFIGGIMSERKDGNLLDIEFILKNGGTIVVREVRIKVFDAIRLMKNDEYDKAFVWGSESGICVSAIAGWRVISQY